MISHKERKKALRQKFTLVLSSDLSQVVKVVQFLLKVNRVLHLDEVQFNQLSLATSEAVTNAIIHGNKQDPHKKVTVICKINSKTIAIHVHDEGEGFDFSARSPSDEHLPNPIAKENLLKENGRGIFLMRTLMDKVKWEKRPDGTEIIMKLKVK